MVDHGGELHWMVIGESFKKGQPARNHAVLSCQSGAVGAGRDWHRPSQHNTLGSLARFDGCNISITLHVLIHTGKPDKYILGSRSLYYRLMNSGRTARQPDQTPISTSSFLHYLVTRCEI